jgi:hypothetical protein
MCTSQKKGFTLEDPTEKDRKVLLYHQIQRRAS